MTYVIIFLLIYVIINMNEEDYKMFDKLQKDMVESLKNGNKDRLTIIRGLKAELMKEKIDKKKEINNDLIIEVASRQIKQLNESIKGFEKGNRSDLVEKALKEIEVLKEYLPEALTEEEVDKIINEAFNRLKPESMKDMGKVMSDVTPKLKGRFDMSIVSTKIRNKLA